MSDTIIKHYQEVLDVDFIVLPSNKAENKLVATLVPTGTNYGTLQKVYSGFDEIRKVFV